MKDKKPHPEGVVFYCLLNDPINLRYNGQPIDQVGRLTIHKIKSVG
jgi:hypothetical protein